MSTVAFLHTSGAHVTTFRVLLSEIGPAAADVHLVDAELLGDARRRGVDADIEQRLLGRLRELAAHGPGVILCTCSTLGGSAEGFTEELGLTVLRVDRPLAECAVANGGRIAIVAAVAATLAPTRRLFEECALEAGSEAVLIEAPCVDAWSLFEAGDHAGYLERVAGHVRGLAAEDFDVIALAQASMAPVAGMVGDLGVPVLSSPRLAVLRAVELAVT